MKPVYRSLMLIGLALTLATALRAQQRPEPPIQIIISEGQVRFAARQPEWQVHLAVQNQRGETIYDSGFNHPGALSWSLADDEEKPLSGGLYRYVLTLRDNGGITVHAHKGSFILEQSADRLWITTLDETAIGTDIVGGELTVTSEGGHTIASARTVEAKTIAQTVSGTDIVAGKGSQPVSEVSGKQLENQEQTSLLGTENRVAKFDVGGVNLIDSAITETGGNVGIGTTSPNAKLSVSANNVAPPSAPGVIGYFANANESNTFLTGDSYGNGNVHSDFLFRRARGTMAAPLAVQADDIVGQIQMRGYGATGFATTSRAGIRLTAAENWSDTAQGAYLAFMTNPIGSASINVERMRLTDAGNLGIGILNPTSRLHVVGDTNLVGNLTFSGTLNGNGANLTNLTGANVTGTVANATNATNATGAVNFSGTLAGDVTGTQSVTAIANNAVTTPKLADGSVTNLKIVDVAGSKITGSVPVASIPAGSGNYIQNQNAGAQASANFNISGNGTAGGTLSGNLVNATTQ